MHESDVKKAVIAANFFERSKLRLNDHNLGGENPIPQKKMNNFITKLLAVLKNYFIFHIKKNVH